MRLSTLSKFNRVLSGLQSNQFQSVRAQEQIASGRRILRPSDDPRGAARLLAVQRELAGMGRSQEAISSGRELLDAAASSLQNASSLMTDAREVLLQGMNGTLSDDDRKALASEFDILRRQLIDIGNQKLGDRYLFAGAETRTRPFADQESAQGLRTTYLGDDGSPLIHLEDGTDVAAGLPGSQVFMPGLPTGTLFGQLTGLSGGVTANEGSGYVNVELRHDATDAAALAGTGIALVDGGAQDTLLGDHTLTIDTTAGTIQLGDGPVRELPTNGSTDFVLQNGLGGELHLDLSGWNGADFTGTVSGQGSIRLAGGTFAPIDFTETDLELSDPTTGTVLHVDTTTVGRAGSELVTFEGALGVFDLFHGIAEDLRNEQGLSSPELTRRLEQRLEDLDQAHEDILLSAGLLGSRSRRLETASDGLSAGELALEGIRSTIEDADLAETALEMAKADMALQLAQSSGARLLQNSLLNFLG